ncbi:trypsin-like serine protease [Bacillus sp. HMF5848]|uniref:S-layer homology domain-containing protein n=1 Tax=Bacillus sp. HMF5848 TaxID=2495421 RepID=UPI000F781BBF|nr:S-layer homology domain-containing protein [Bacillus sp. HMF5848]RSK28648.1 trypsin-like serine protease [Bacillus sp. HMF5848]
MKKLRWTVIGVLLLLVAPNLTGAAVQPTTFTDVQQYKNEIQFLADQKIVTGYEDGSFQPAKPVTRLQAVQMILRAKQVKLNNATVDPQLKDMREGDYGYAEVAKAVELGIVSGRDDGSFAPYDTLTRAQMAKIIVNAYSLDTASQFSFSDVTNNHWAHDFVSVLAGSGVTTGYDDGRYKPNETLSRQHFSVFLARKLNNEFVPATSKATLVKKVAAFENSVGMVMAYDQDGDVVSQGSGFVVVDGFLLTNYHVIEGGTTFSFVDANWNEHEIDGVVKTDKQADLAILKLKETGLFPALAVGPLSSVEKGERIVTVGSPQGLLNTVSDGLVSGLHTMEDGVEVLQISAPITHGNSGGPVFDTNGYAIGITTFGYDTGNLNFAISLDEAKTWITDLKAKSHAAVPVISFRGTPVQQLAPGVALDLNIALPDQVRKVVQHPTKPVMYMINDVDYKVTEVNYQTGDTRSITLSYQPQDMFFEGGNLYVALLKQPLNNYRDLEDQKGAIAVINTNTFVKEKQFDIILDPGSIVVDSHNVYISPGSGQHIELHAFSKTTGVLAFKAGYYNSVDQIAMHPFQNKMYSIDDYNNSIDVVFLHDGQFAGSMNLHHMYHKYELTDKSVFSPDGRYLFNGSGDILYTTNYKDTNLTLAASMETGFTSIAFDMENKLFYTSDGFYVDVYDYETFTILDSFEMEKGMLVTDLVFRDGFVYAVAEVESGKLVETRLYKIAIQ